MPSSLDEFLCGASANRRQQIRRTRRKVFAVDGVKFRQIEDPAELPRYLAALYDLHERRWALQDDREVVCAVYDMNGGKLTGSMQDASI